MKLAYLAGVLGVCLAATSLAGPIGPLPYLSAADSPWAAVSFSQFYREDFEDGALNTPGVIAVGAQSINPAGGVFTDSVDGDDGAIDGSGTNGRSHYTANGVAGIEYSFNAGVLGQLPTHAGIVWTDLSDTADVFFEAFDSASLSLGVIAAGALNDGLSTGETAEDRFLGWEHAAGIARIHIYQSGSDMEVDHLQYGIAVPEPTGGALALIAGALFMRRRLRFGADVHFNASDRTARNPACERSASAVNAS